MRQLLGRISLVGLIALLPASLAMMRWSQPLEGTKWKVKVTPDEDAAKSGADEFDDILIFKGGKFITDTFRKKGVAPAEFEEDTRRGPVATFSAELSDGKGGKSKWTGTITGSEVIGQVQWTSKNGSGISFTFKGEKVQS